MMNVDVMTTASKSVQIIVTCMLRWRSVLTNTHDYIFFPWTKFHSIIVI